MTLLAHEIQIQEIYNTLQQLKSQNKKTTFLSDDMIVELEKALEDLKRSHYSNLSPIDRVAICRHPLRPKSYDYITHCFTDFIEISGDRTFGDDPSIIAGFAKLNDTKLVIVAQEKGNDTESRLFRNFGMPHPEGYRKALRAFKLAEKFHLPIVCLLDTPGAFPGLAAEDRGQGWAISQNLLQMSQVKTPIITLVIGEGCSGGALGIGVGNIIGMLEHAYYSVISPEGCASILWKDSSKKDLAAKALKMQAEDLMDLEVIDSIIAEPLGGAHLNKEVTYINVKDFLLKSLHLFEKMSSDELVQHRYNKFRNMGKFYREITSSSHFVNQLNGCSNNP